MLDNEGINYQIEERYSGYIVYSTCFSCVIHMYIIDISIETIDVMSFRIKNDLDDITVFIMEFSSKKIKYINF